jgi:hypothetical protein
MKAPTIRTFAIGLAMGLALLATLGLAACGQDTADSAGVDAATGAQPARDGSLVPGEFVDLPEPDGARPYGPPTQKDGTWTQSFEVDGLSPAQTMQFYVTTLEGSWGEARPLPQLGSCDPPGGASGSTCVYSAVWIRGDETLKVVAGPAGLDVSNGTETSLLLRGAE